MPLQKTKAPIAIAQWCLFVARATNWPANQFYIGCVQGMNLARQEATDLSMEIIWSKPIKTPRVFRALIHELGELHFDDETSICNLPLETILWLIQQV